MATASKTATSPKTIVSTLKSDDQLKVEALDAYLKAEDAATKASKKKSTTKGVLMGLTVHGERLTSSDGRARQIVNEKVATSSWEKVARELAAKAGMSDAALEKRAKQLGSDRKVQEVKTF